MAALGVISATLCAPALPFIADHFKAHFAYIQFTISLFLLGNAFGQFASGPVSDQIGPRTTLLGGLILFTMASLFCATATSMPLLLTARFFQGMGSSVGPVLARAIAANTFDPKKSAQMQSYGALGIGIASIFSILCSGFLTFVSWRANFWFAVGLGVVLFLWTRIALKPTAQVTGFALRQMLPQIKNVLKHPQFLSQAFCHTMTYGLMYGYIALFPFLTLEFFHEKNPGKVGWYSALMIVCYMLGAFLASRGIAKWGNQQLVKGALMMQLLSGLILLFFPMPALFLFNITIGVVLPLTSAHALAPFAQTAAGAASSCLGLTYRLIGSVLSTFICLLPMAGGKTLGLSIFALAGISLWVVNLQKPASQPV